MSGMETNKCSAVKIKEYKVRRCDRGQTIALPAIWSDDVGIKPGDKIEMYRNEQNHLILVAKRKEQHEPAC